MRPTDLVEGIHVRCLHPVVGLTHGRHYTIMEVRRRDFANLISTIRVRDEITRGEPAGGAFGYWPWRFERVV